MLFQPLPARWLAAVAGWVALAASGQTPAPAAAPPPWRSTLEAYQPFTDEKVAPWKETNDTVGRIGGWRAYAREAAGAKVPASGPAAAKPDPRAGHGKP